MKLEIKGNENYSAQIIEIKEIHPLENADNIVGSMILGNHVIVSKDTKIGDIGIFFPVECKISDDFLKYNNLYSHKELNEDTEKSGFFGDRGRVKAVRLRGHKSEGFWIPVESLSFYYRFIDDFKEYIGESFDHINDIKICEKYIIPVKQQSQGRKGKGKGRKAKVSKIVTGQFHFHDDTYHLGRNIHKLSLDDEIQITVKYHGTSAISSNIICLRKLNWFQKFLLKIGLKLDTKYYDNIYSSRKVIKNDDINKTQHFYSEDIWKKGNDRLLEYLDKGMTIYYEIVGYLGDNTAIQSMKKIPFDYGCKPGEFDILIYRITLTNYDGKVYEFTPDQIYMWCQQRSLKSVEELWRGTIKDLLFLYPVEHIADKESESFGWYNDTLEVIRKQFGLEKDCWICKSKVPFEGVVVRKCNTLEFEAYKLKSFKFLEAESKEHDAGQTNIEDNQEEKQND